MTIRAKLQGDAEARDHYFLTAKSSVLGLKPPSLTIKTDHGAFEIYGVECPPQFAFVFAPLWRRLVDLGSTYRADQLAEELARDGLTRRTLGGRDEKPLDDPSLRFWIWEAANQLVLPLSPAVKRDELVGFGCSRNLEDVTAAIADRRRRSRAGMIVAREAERALELYEQTGDLSTWKVGLDGPDWSEADRAVARRLIGEMEVCRVKGDDLAALAQASDSNRAWTGSASVRPMISRLRRLGAPITATNEGYALADSASEYRAWLDGYKSRFESIETTAKNLHQAGQLWFSDSEAAVAARSGLRGPLEPRAPSAEAIERLNRVHESEAKERAKNARRRKTVAERARDEIEILRSHPDWQTARDTVGFTPERATEEQKEMVARFEGLVQKAKRKPAKRKRATRTPARRQAKPAVRRGRPRPPQEASESSAAPPIPW